MPQPTKPGPGDPIASEWGGQLLDYIGEKWKFHPLPVTQDWTATPTNTNVVTVEALGLPANDPTVVAAHVALMVRDGGGSTNAVAKLRHFDKGDTNSGDALMSYTSGTAGRGGFCGPAPVRVGGVNNRQYKVVPAANMGHWVYTMGYWTRETPSA